MTTLINVRTATMPQLVAFFNANTGGNPVKKFADRLTAEKRVQRLVDEMIEDGDLEIEVEEVTVAAIVESISTPTHAVIHKEDRPTAGPRPAMQASLKLDRRIKNVKTGETWKNAYQMWKANPEWLTSAQVDRLTGTLYSAAKNGYQVTITINDRDFSLVQVAV